MSRPPNASLSLAGQPWALLSWVLLAAGVGYASMFIAIALFGRAAFSSDWLYLSHAMSGVGTWDAAWIALEGHRQVLPRLLAALDIRALNASNAVLAPAGIVAHLILVGVIVWIVGHAAAFGNRVARRAAMGLALVLLCYAPDTSYFTRGDSQLLWVPLHTAVSFLAVTAFSVSVGKSGRIAGAWPHLAGLLASGVTLTSIAGVFVWPAFLYIAIATRARARAWLPLVGWFVLAAWAFLRGNTIFQIDSGGAMANLFDDPLDTFLGLAWFVGTHVNAGLFVAPLSSMAPMLTPVIGGIGLMLQVGFLIEGLFRRRATGPQALALGVLGMTFLTNLAYAMKHSVPGAEINPFDRLWGMVALTWLSIAFLVWQRWGETRVLVSRMVPVLGLVAAIALAPSAIFNVIRVAGDARLMDATGIAVAVGVHDDQLKFRFAYATADIRTLSDFLRRQKWAPADGSAATLIGQSLAGTRALPACDGGAVTGNVAASQSNPARRLWGTWPAGVGGTVEEIVVADDAGQIVGMGRSWAPPSFAKYFPDLGPQRDEEGWLGYHRADGEGPWHVVVLNGAGNPICRIE